MLEVHIRDDTVRLGVTALEQVRRDEARPIQYL